MVKKSIALIMLALIALPFCCCLFASETVEQQQANMPCCESSEMPDQAVPGNNDSLPCDCENHESLAMLVPEITSLDTVVWKLDFIAGHPLIQEVPALQSLDDVLLSSPALSAFHPPGWRLLQEYCVYRI